MKVSNLSASDEGFVVKKNNNCSLQMFLQMAKHLIFFTLLWL
jgi:hypothetical protein